MLVVLQGDNARVTYRIVNDETGSGNDILWVNSSSGDVSAAMKFDRESVDIFSVRVLAEDSGRPRRTAWSIVNIHVLDADDHPVTFSQQMYV